MSVKGEAAKEGAKILGNAFKKVVGEGKAAAEEVAESGVKTGADRAAEYAVKEGAEQATKEGAEQTAKTGTEQAAKQGAEQAVKAGTGTVAEEAAKAASKSSAWRRFMESAKQKGSTGVNEGDVHFFGRQAKKVPKFMFAHPVISAGVAFGVAGQVTGKGGGQEAADFANGWAFGDDAKDKSLAENSGRLAVDGMFGAGTFDLIRDKLKESTAEGKEDLADLYRFLRAEAGNAADRFESFQSGELKATEAVTAVSPTTRQDSMMLTIGNRQVDLSQYNEEERRQLLSYAAAVNAQQPATGADIFRTIQDLSPMENFKSLLSYVTGGGTGTSVAAMIPAAMLLFGNYGFMAKIASVMLGTFAYKNAKQARQQEMYERLATRQAYAQRTPSQLYDEYENAQNEQLQFRGLHL